MDENNKISNFISSILLSKPSFDVEKFKDDLKEQWDITVPLDDEDTNGLLVFNVGDMLATVALMQERIPDEEAENNAMRNYQWPDAVDRAKQHKSHIIVAVLGEGTSLEKARLFAKLSATCCRQKNVLGIYVNGTVQNPEMYSELASLITEEYLPVYLLVWVGLYQTDNGVNAYTFGLKSFGKDEIEIIESNINPNHLFEFLNDISNYVIESDVILSHGETIGATAEQKLPITRSEGVSISGMTLKIEYNN